MRPVLIFMFFALPLLAADSDAEKQRQERVAAEVQRRVQLRKEAAAAEEKALRVVRDHESGEKKVSESELAAMRAIVREAEGRRAKAKSNAPKKDDSVELSLPDADMATVASAWRLLFGTPVSVSDRAKSKIVRIKFSAVPRQEAQRKLISGLKEHGIYVVSRAGGLTLDIEPDPNQSK